ncbi:hypothetical protein C0Q70_09567 [Pomacea canaliculata]|uniref:Charged multivesicular body protein 7 n=1 Tax=Pomacea canaliculata TaxID=400727 RepID=A0A2T7PA60_POMCA|nr:hypothetical protein C0Q70_09567 [Pomacea canaliculata]
MESASFRLSSDWLDDQKAAVLFSPFRDKALNPHSWDKKMNFWISAVWECILVKNKFVWNLQGLTECFERKGKIPKCLDSVIAEMIKMGKLKRMTEFEKQSSSWTAWGYDTFLKRPLLWGLSKVFSSSSLAESDTFVIPELIKKRSIEVMELHYSQVQHATTDNIVELTTFRKQCEKILEDDTEFEMVIKYLQVNKQIVKFSHQLNSKVIPFEEIELNIFRIQKVLRQLEHQIETLSQQSDIYRLEAKKLVKEKKKTLALHQLRKHRTLLRQIEKKSACANSLHAIMHKIEEASSNELVVKAYESGLNAILHATGNLTIEKVDKVLDDLQLVLEDQEEINQAISGVGLPGSDVSQDDLERELNSLLAESNAVKENVSDDIMEPSQNIEDLLENIATFSLSDLPEVPSGSPGKSKMSYDALTAT